MPNIDFIGRRNVWFVLSGFFILLSLVGLIFRGLNFSIEFTGGSLLRFPNASGASAEQYGGIMSRFGVRDATVEIVAGGSDCASGCVNIRTKESLSALGAAPSATPTATPTPTASVSATPGAVPTATASPLPSASPSVSAAPSSVPGPGLPTFKADQLSQALAGAAHIQSNDINEEDVGPTWGSTISRKAIVALIVFLILVSLYITFRFELKMAAGALVALGHDLIITAGIYALVGREVTPETVIAILTILGYSLYDTVVIFDKVKENTESAALVARDTYSGVVNMSLNQTFMRSVNTSLVVLLPIGALLAFGGATLKDFAFALFIGVASGTYSSIFVAAPILALAKEREPRYQQIRARAAARTARPGLRSASTGRALSEAPDRELAPAGAGAATATQGRATSTRSSSQASGASRARQGQGGGQARKKKGKSQGKAKPRRR